MSRGRLVLVYGTRPESLKLGPVAAELRALGAPLTIACTGQHTTLLDGMPSQKDLGGCSLNLPSNGNWTDWVEAAVPVIADFLAAQKPVAAVIVQGDTMSAYATSLAADQLNIPIAHVEAGLRSHDLQNPKPEEYFRREITGMASWHYAPTPTSLQNLLNEGVPQSACFVTGNTVVSALSRYTPDGLTVVPHPKPQILVTMHRREWLNEGTGHVVETVQALCDAARRLPHLTFQWPMHPSLTNALSDADFCDAPQNVWLSDPLSYIETVDYLRHSMGLITDSGGLTEEAATLGIPTFVLRHATDRPEAETAGIAVKAPPSPDGMTWAVQMLTDQRNLGRILRTPSRCFSHPKSHNGMMPARSVAEHLASLT